MVQINFAQKQINAKIVYYGPGMSGKTTNLEIVHQRAPSNNRGDLTSISTDGDRTLFFDYMPLDLGSIAGMKTCFQMYTVPGQVYYNSTRKLVLQGVDGVIFIADSGPDCMEANIEAMRNLEENLNEYGKSLATLPHVIQYNKRDLPDAMPLEQLEQALNAHGAPTFEGVASTGQGVFPTLKGLAALVLRNIQAECAGGTSQLARTGFHNAPGAAQPVQQPAAAPPPATPTPARAPIPVEEQVGAGAQAAGGLELRSRQAASDQSHLASTSHGSVAQPPMQAQPHQAPQPHRPQPAQPPRPPQPPTAQARAAQARPAPTPAHQGRPTAPQGAMPSSRQNNKPAMGSTQIMRRSTALGSGSTSGAAARTGSTGAGSSRGATARRTHAVPSETSSSGGGSGKTLVLIGLAAVIGAGAAFALLKFL